VIVVVDNVITQTADPHSKPLGRFQAQYVLDGSIKYCVQATILINFSEDLVEITYGVCNFGWSELATISAPV
jgi:hypothetical protein